MNPYEILGVDPAAGIDEIEARYRLLVREYHPDLHQDEGADAIEFCETTTRNLNSAMARIRDLTIAGGGAAWSPTDPAPGADRPGGMGPDPRTTGQWPGANPFYRESDAGATGAAPPGADRERDWFGNPIDHAPDEPVPCPFCGTGFERLADYEDHLAHAHDFRQTVAQPRRERRPNVIVRTVGALRLIPSWFVALVAFTLWRLFGFYYFVGGITFLLLVMWTQTAKMFKRR